MANLETLLIALVVLVGVVALVTWVVKAVWKR